MGQIAKFIYKNRIFFFPFFIVIGLILAFSGLKLAKFSFFTAGFFIASGLCFMIIYNNFINSETEKWKEYTFLTISIIIGMVVGFFSAKIRKLGTILLGSWLGYMVSYFLYTAFLFRISPKHKRLIRHLSSVILVILFAFLGFKLFNVIFILATSFCGSFLAIYSIGLLAGNFPNYDYVT